MLTHVSLHHIMSAPNPGTPPVGIINTCEARPVWSGYAFYDTVGVEVKVEVR